MTRASRVRTLLGLAAASAAVFALAACSSGAPEASSGASAAGDEYGLVKAGTLTVATEGTYRPFSYHEDGSGDLVGYDVEVAEAVADKLGLEIEFEETQWDAIFAGLDAGRFDVIANQVSINPEREEQYLFSAPYTVSSGVIVVNEGDASISSFDDLAGKTTAQSLTSNWNELARSRARTSRPSRAGRRPSHCCSRARRRDHQRRAHLPRLREHERPVGHRGRRETDDSSLSALAFTKDKADLVAAIDTALEELRAEGVLAELGEKYFGADVSE